MGVFLPFFSPPILQLDWQTSGWQTKKKVEKQKINPVQRI
jgi:hypothetical protein